MAMPQQQKVSSKEWFLEILKEFEGYGTQLEHEKHSIILENYFQDIIININSDNMDRILLKHVENFEKKNKCTKYSILYDICASELNNTYPTTSMTNSGYLLLLKGLYIFYSLCQAHKRPFKSGLVIQRKSLLYSKLILDIDVIDKENEYNNNFIENRQKLITLLIKEFSNMFGVRVYPFGYNRNYGTPMEIDDITTSQEEVIGDITTILPPPITNTTSTTTTTITTATASTSFNNNSNCIITADFEQLLESRDNNNESYKSNIPFLITSRPNKMNFHIILDVSLDTFSQAYLYKYLKYKYEMEFKKFGYSLDYPFNVSLPAVRQHECLNVSMASFKMFKLLSPIDIWTLGKNLWGINCLPSPNLELLIDSADYLSIIINDSMDQVYEKKYYTIDYGKDLNFSHQFSIFFNPKLSTLSNEYKIQINLNCIRFGEIILGKIKRFIPMLFENQNSHIVGSISEFYELYQVTDIEHNYLFTENIENIAAATHCERNFSTEHILNELSQDELLLTNNSTSDSIDDCLCFFKESFYPFNEIQLEILLQIQTFKNNIEYKQKLEKLDYEIQNAIVKYFNDIDYSILFFMNLLYQKYCLFWRINTESFILNNQTMSKMLKSLCESMSTMTYEDQNEIQTLFINREKNWLLHIISIMLNNGCVSSTLSLLLRLSNKSLSVIVIWIFYKIKLNPHSTYILSKWCTIENSDKCLINNYYQNDILYYLLSSIVSTKKRYENLKQQFFSIVKSVNVPATKIVYEFFFRHIILTRRLGNLYLIFSNNCPTIMPIKDKKDIDTIIELPEYSSTTSNQSYEIFIHNIIYNPMLNIFEIATPSVQSLIVLTPKVNIPDILHTISCVPNIQDFLLDIYFKIPHFIKNVHYTQLQVLLLAPIFNQSLHEQYKDIEKVFEFLPYPECKFIIGSYDLSKDVPWPQTLDEEILNMNTQKYPTLAKYWKVFVGILCTLSERYDVPKIKISLLDIMFGTEIHELLGLPIIEFNKNGIPFIPRNTFIPTSNDTINSNYGNDFDKYPYNGESTTTFNSTTSLLTAEVFLNNDCDHTKFYTLLEHEIKRIRNETIRQDRSGLLDVFNVKTTCDPSTLSSLSSSRTTTMISDGEHSNNSVLLQEQQPMWGFKLNFDLQDGTEPLLHDKINHFMTNCIINWDTVHHTNLRHLPIKFLRNTFLIFSWILRMGHTHVYMKTDFFKRLLNDKIKVYNELCTLIYNTIGHYVHFTDVKDLAKLLQDFCETSQIKFTMSSDKRPKITNDWKYKLEFYEKYQQLNVYPAASLLENNAIENKLLELREEFYIAFSSLILHSEFNADIFVDISKFISSINYRGNFLRTAFMLYNKTATGKSVFGELLSKLFKTPVHSNVMSKSFGKNPQNDYDSMASQMANNLIIWVNEIESYSTERIKALIDTGSVTSRYMCSNQTTSFKINAKILLTCNNALEIHDAAIMNRLHPISKKMQYVKYDQKDIVDRCNRSIDLGSLATGTSLLGGILLMDKIPSYPTDTDLNGIFLLNRLLFIPLFFNTPDKPVSITKSPTSLRHYTEYIIKGYPVQSFLASVKISNSNKGITEDIIQKLIIQWWSLHKLNFSSNISQVSLINEILDGLSAYFCPDRQQYFLSIQFIRNI